jgi:hypothetical protein
MTPKEKAIELFDKYNKTVNTITNKPIKQCALIAVNLLMEEAYRQHDYEGFISYWKEVKQEIEKL